MYQRQIGIGLLAIAVLAMPLFLKLPAQTSSFMAQAQLKAREEQERDRITERAKTSDALYQAGVMPTTKKLRITNYIDNRKNPRPDTTVYQDDEIVQVFDSTGRCIGEISDGTWKWKRKFPDICNGVENVPAVKRRVNK